MTLSAALGELGALMPELIRLRSGALLPGAASAAVRDMGLADDDGLTRKGVKVLDQLYALANLLDIPCA